MTNKLTFILLGAVLLAQCSRFAAADDSSSSEESGSNEKDSLSQYMSDLKELPARTRILIITLRESEQLTVIDTQKTAAIFNKVLQDVAVLSAPSANLKKHLDRFTRYTEEIKRLQTRSRSRTTVEDAAELEKLYCDILLGTLKVGFEFAGLLQQYNTSVALVEPSMEDLLVRLLLEKNHFTQLLQKINSDFEIFKLVIYEELEKYLDVVPAYWYKDFKAEPEIRDLYEFFGFYTEEEMKSTTKFLKI